MKSVKSDLEEFALGGTCFIKSEYRGNNLGGIIMDRMGMFLHNKYGYRGLYIFVVSPQFLNGLSKQGFTLLSTSYYDEFEYKGEKVFENVKPNRYYLNNKPALYGIYKDYTEVLVDDDTDTNSSY